MENIQTSSAVHSTNAFAFDTTFVLFFLSMDLGQRGFFSVDGIIMSIALMAVMLMPYLFETNDEVSFGRWAVERCFIAGFGMFTGLAFNASVGTVFPETLESLPFTLVIMASMVSCFLTFASLLGFRFTR
jgi:hypothetical protein